MLDEGLEGDSPEESEKKPRTYVSNAPQTDPEKLARELERLKKSLEKEQFFNRLLDQELKELKNTPGGEEPVYPSFSEKKGLSGGAILVIFLLVAGVGGYFGYQWLTRQPVNNFTLDDPTPAISDSTAEAQTRLNNSNTVTPSSIDSSDIIAKKSVTPAEEIVPKNDPPVDNEKKEPPKREEKKKPETAAQDNADEDLPVEDEPVNKPTKPVTQQQQTTTTPPPNTTPANQPSATKPSPTNTTPTTTSTPSSGGLTNVNNIMTPPLNNRRILGLYANVSKANFYRAPDESTMMTSFLFQGNSTQVGALADQNGFIYVEYTNAVGYTIKGWLSKKDLKRLN